MGATPEQLTVTQNIDDYNLVVAAPGSGKTFTVIQSLLELLKVDSHRVVAVTFTNAAAEEMRERVGKAIPKELRKNVHISTFHSILISQAKKVGLGEGLKLVVGGEAQQFIYYVMKSWNEQSGIKRKFTDLYDVLSKAGTHAGNAVAAFEMEVGLVGFYDYYCRTLKQLGVWTLDMVSREVVNAMQLGKIEPIAATHLLVDESQDIDPLQLDWISIHAASGVKTTLVGDDDQSIYGFRESLGFKGMTAFRDSFSAKQYTLSVCFRCAPEILQAANRLIANNLERIPKTVKAGQSIKGYTYLISADDDAQEAVTICATMREESALSRAVLARTNAQLDVIEAELKQSKIDYQRLNGTSIWQNRGMVEWIRIIYTIIHPENNRYLSEVLVGLHEEMDSIEEVMNATGRSGFHHVQLDSLVWSNQTAEFQEICLKYGYLKKSQDAADLTRLMGACCSLFEEYGLKKSLIRFAPTVEKILESMFMPNLGSAIDKAIEYQQSRTKKNLDSEVVTLTTFHGSKGLEWDLVWLAAVNKVEEFEGEFDFEDVEEERRLLFVAMTRARQKLFLSWHVDNQSEFLTEAFGEKNVQSAIHRARN